MSSDPFEPNFHHDSFPPLLIPILLCRDDDNELPVYSMNEYNIQDILVPKNFNIRFPVMSNIFENDYGYSLFTEYSSLKSENPQARNNLQAIMKFCLFSVGQPIEMLEENFPSLEPIELVSALTITSKYKVNKRVIDPVIHFHSLCDVLPKSLNSIPKLFSKICTYTLTTCSSIQNFHKDVFGSTLPRECKYPFYLISIYIYPSLSSDTYFWYTIHISQNI